MALEFRILGPLEVTDGDRALDLGSPKQRALLALLLIHANRTLTTDRILDELWGDEAQGRENALWVYISRLRAVLEPGRPARGDNTVLVTRDHGYALTVDPDAIDAVRFEAQVATGRDALRDDPVASSAALAGALALWRGEALQDFTYDEFARSERDRLEELRVAATADRIDADLRAGRAGELVGELEVLHRQHPVRERFVGQLMLALYRSGRHVDALRVSERFRRHLRDEAGLDPSPELRRLEERVLVHDPRLDAPRAVRATTPIVAANPFRGLRAFGEHDTAVFHGRERLVADVLRRIGEGAPLVALVGPSGSGKSSVVGAGIVPAIRKQAADGSDPWVVAWMVPGAHPLVELEAALRRASLDPPHDLGALVSDPTTGMLRAVLGVLPDADARLLLVIDQFEELFSLVEDTAARDRFLDQLVTVIDDPRHRAVVVLTLRADFYSRPLDHPEFGARLGDGVVNVVPLRPDELETAAQQPVAHAGVHIEPALLAALLTDVVGRPGTLPLFQYALTELFERRTGDTLTLASYEAMGGVGGSVTTRADDLFARLSGVEQAAIEQVFLRLVAIGERDAWTRRRTAVSEIVALRVDVVALERVIDAYAGHRLLTLDRDDVTGSPTVEVAHEALLTEWGRLRTWIERARDDIRRHAALVSAMTEWLAADRNPGYLLAGTRLDDYERWAATATMQLTDTERIYLEASVRRRDDAAALEAQRLASQRRLAASARRRLWAITAMVAVLIVVGTVAVTQLVGAGGPRVVAVMPSVSDDTQELIAAGLERAARELGVDAEVVRGRSTVLAEQHYRELADAGTDLVLIDPDAAGPDVEAVIAEHPDTTFAVIGSAAPPAGAHAVTFADEHAGYLAGAAAGATTQARIVGIVGDVQHLANERVRAGFEAGVRSVDPDITVLATYMGTIADGSSVKRNRANAAADQLYERGADVVFAAAAAASVGVFEAALDRSLATGWDVFGIGTGADGSALVSEDMRNHVVGSVVRRWDVAVFETVRTLVDGDQPRDAITLTATDGALGLTTSQSPIDRVPRRVEAAIDDIRTGDVTVPTAPAGEVIAPPNVDVTDVATVTWDGEVCAADTLADVVSGGMARADFVNDSPEAHGFVVEHDRVGRQITVVAPPGARTAGHAIVTVGALELGCASPAPDDGLIDSAQVAATVEVRPP